MEAEATTGASTEAEPAQTALRRIDDARAAGHQALALSGLGLRDLPDELRALTCLRELDLSDNELTALPAWVATFPDLRVLDLRRNHLVEVPWQLGMLELSSLELDGNPHLLLPPPETVAQGTAAVLADLRASALLREGDGAASRAELELLGGDELEDAEISDQGSGAALAVVGLGTDLGGGPGSDSGAESSTASGPFSGTVSRAAAVSGAAVLLLAAVGVAAAVGSGGTPSHQAARALPAGADGGSASDTATGPAGEGFAGATPGSTSVSTTVTTTAAGSVVTSGAPPAARPPVVTVTAPATATAPGVPIVQTTRLPTTPPLSTTAVRVVVTKTVAPTVTRTKVAPAPVVTSTVRQQAPAPSGPVPISVTNATGQLTGINGMCVDDYASNTADYSEVDIWNCDNTGAQSWTWVEAGSTLHVLGLCMDVQGAGTASGTTVDLYHCNGTGAQVFIPRSDGSLYNPNSGKCLDDPNASTNRGTALQIWDCNGSVAQRWQLP